MFLGELTVVLTLVTDINLRERKLWKVAVRDVLCQSFVLLFCLSDHVALMIELLGDIPKSVAVSGKYSNEIFDRRGTFCFHCSRIVL